MPEQQTIIQTFNGKILRVKGKGGVIAKLREHEQVLIKYLCSTSFILSNLYYNRSLASFYGLSFHIN
jgi:hypothetical protein